MPATVSMSVARRPPCIAPELLVTRGVTSISMAQSASATSTARISNASKAWPGASPRSSGGPRLAVTSRPPVRATPLVTDPPIGQRAWSSRWKTAVVHRDKASTAPVPAGPVAGVKPPFHAARSGSGVEAHQAVEIVTHDLLHIVLGQSLELVHERDRVGHSFGVGIVRPEEDFVGTE